MSDYWIRFIPTEPHHVPDPTRQAAAHEWVQARFPNADDVSTYVSAAVEFVDAGGNFERVLCPLCGADCEQWWGSAMESKYDNGFHDLNVRTGCCGRPLSLNDLRYELPAGFARLVLDVRNPDGDDLGDSELRVLEEIAGCSLRRIYRRL
jgi:hypothetical protein